MSLAVREAFRAFSRAPMLSALSITTIAFSLFAFGLFGPRADATAQGAVFALMVMTVAAAEATVGLAIVIAIYRNKRTPLVDEYDAMRQ